MKKTLALLLLILSVSSSASCIDAYKIKADKRNQVYTVAGTVGLLVIKAPLAASATMLTGLSFLTLTYSGMWLAYNPDEYYLRNQFKQIEGALKAAEVGKFDSKDFQKIAKKTNRISQRKFNKSLNDQDIAQLLNQVSSNRSICPDIKVGEQRLKFILNKNELARLIAYKSQQVEIVLEPVVYEKLPQSDVDHINRITQSMMESEQRLCPDGRKVESKVDIAHYYRPDIERHQTSGTISFRCNSNDEWSYTISCEYRKYEQTNQFEIEYCDT